MKRLRISLAYSEQLLCIRNCVYRGRKKKPFYQIFYQYKYFGAKNIFICRIVQKSISLAQCLICIFLVSFYNDFKNMQFRIKINNIV